MRTTERLEVRIKYCGGCNPYFKRESIEEILRANYKFINFSFEDGVFTVAINGCTTDCVSGEVVFNSMESEEQIRKKFESFLEKYFPKI